MKVLIIDDEQNARELIRNMIVHSELKITEVREAENVRTGHEAILEFKPDVVLLDVQMPDGNGFDLLRKLDTPAFKLIFITAYQQFALQAFKFSALDYILKPIDQEDLLNALRRAAEHVRKHPLDFKLDVLYENLNNLSKENKKIIIKGSEQIHAVPVKDIVRCESDGNYTSFYLVNGKKLLATKILKEFDEMLEPFGFFRAHQSHLINMDYFESLKKADGGSILMKDGSVIPLASRKKEAFLKHLSNL